MARSMEEGAAEGDMEFGENDIFIAMEEGDLDGEELDDLDDTDRPGTHVGTYAARNMHGCSRMYCDPGVVEESDEDEALQAATDGDTSMEPVEDHAVHQCTEHQGECMCGWSLYVG